ncbi:hypothetical protein X975_03917, partial [Stegodyphus mimosarum]
MILKKYSYSSRDFSLLFTTFFYDQNKIAKAIAMQHTLTYGLFLSPILAHFQNTPRNPSLFLSSKLGARDLTYEHVQISRRTTVSKL